MEAEEPSRQDVWSVLSGTLVNLMKKCVHLKMAASFVFPFILSFFDQRIYNFQRAPPTHPKEPPQHITLIKVIIPKTFTVSQTWLLWG